MCSSTPQPLAHFHLHPFFFSNGRKFQLVVPRQRARKSIEQSRTSDTRTALNFKKRGQDLLLTTFACSFVTARTATSSNAASMATCAPRRMRLPLSLPKQTTRTACAPMAVLQSPSASSGRIPSTRSCLSSKDTHQGASVVSFLWLACGSKFCKSRCFWIRFRPVPSQDGLSLVRKVNLTVTQLSGVNVTHLSVTVTVRKSANVAQTLSSCFGKASSEARPCLHIRAFQEAKLVGLEAFLQISDRE